MNGTLRESVSLLNATAAAAAAAAVAFRESLSDRRFAAQRQAKEILKRPALRVERALGAGKAEGSTSDFEIEP